MKCELLSFIQHNLFISCNIIKQLPVDKN